MVSYNVDGNFHIYLRDMGKNEIIEIPVTSCTISEEDLRIKSAKISSYVEIDLSSEMTWVYITYMNKTIYGGDLLSSDYDENKGIYNYQSLGHQRWLTSKTWFVHNPEESKKDDLYKGLENFIEKIKKNTSIGSVELLPKEKYSLYPMKNLDKDNKDGWSLKDGLFYENKTYYEILMSLIAESNNAIDCYVTEDNILKLEPINLDSWKNADTITILPSDLSGYDFKSDATNIVTGIYIKSTDIYKEHKETTPDFYSSEKMIGVDLTAYYGKMETFESGKTKKVSTTEDKTTTDDEGNTTTETTTTQKDVADVEANEKLARSKITTSIRDLMSFTIEINKYLPNLHTNMFIWFITPKKHSLANYSKFVAKIDETTIRGGEYVLNRFYVENIDTTYDDKGIKSKITINPFASDMSEYAKAYDDAKNAYEQANCSSNSDSSGSTGSVGSTGSTGTRTSSPPANAGTITVNMMPSTAGSMPPYQYKRYTKTWRNWCPVCGKANTFKDNPKGVYEGEITCSMKLGGCDADWDGVTGKNKAGNCPNPGCKYNWTFLVDANGRRNSKGNIDVTVGGSNGSTSGATGSSGASTNCVSSSGSLGGSYNVSSAISNLANKVITDTSSEQGACKSSLRLRYNFIQYHGYSNFIRSPEQVISMGGGNCCDGTRLQLNMLAYKGVATNKLIFVHIYGHVYGNFNNQNDMDWVKGTNGWNNHWGSGSLLRKSTFPKTPFGSYKYGILTDYFTNMYNRNLTLEEDNFIEENEKVLFDFFKNDFTKINNTTIKELIEVGYKNYNEYVSEQPTYFIEEFEDVENRLSKV